MYEAYELVFAFLRRLPSPSFLAAVLRALRGAFPDAFACAQTREKGEQKKKRQKKKKEKDDEQGGRPPPTPPPTCSWMHTFTIVTEL